MFRCNECNYETDHKPNYNRHINSQKHKYKCELVSRFNQYECIYCNHSYKRRDTLTRHLTKCTVKLLKEKDDELKKKDDDYKKIISKLNDEIVSLRNKNEELNDKLHLVKDTQLTVLQNNLKPSNNNNTQIIINNFPNAPNLNFPDTIKVDESLREYIQLGSVRGLGKFISDHWGRDINPQNRSIWLVDCSRNKFLVRYENAWVIDIDGKQFQDVNIEKIQNLFNDYLKKYKFDTYDYIKTMEFILDINTKNMIIKGLKDAGKYLVYDKEKFTNFEQIDGL